MRQASFCTTRSHTFLYFCRKVLSCLLRIGGRRRVKMFARDDWARSSTLAKDSAKDEARLV